MPNPYTVTVTVEAPDRGAEQQTYLKFAAAQCVCTWSWGLQPATALIDWVSLQQQPPVLPMSNLTIEIREAGTKNLLHTFYGICKSIVPVVGSDGFTTYQEFVDSREFLQYDVVYGCFNKRESRIIDSRWVRRYWHILPADFNTQARTYTNAPLTGAQILDYLFGAPTIESPWVRVYHAALNFPVYDVDCMGGKKLGTAVTEISEALGCVFTLMGGRYRLVWTMKGTGSPPAFPDNSDNRRAGTAISGNPTRVRILGDRNLYQVMDLALGPDWQAAWQEFYDLDMLADDLFRYESTEAPCAGIPAGTRYNAIAGDTGNLQGRYLAQARSRVVTVGQYAALRDARNSDGEQFRDYRRFGGRSRLAMPAALYIQTVMFRAFRPPATFTLVNLQGLVMNLYGLELMDRGLVEVTHDPVTGKMSYGLDVISASNGYAIAQGYCVGQDGYKTLRPENFQLDAWVNGQSTWQHLTFQIDDSGDGTKFIIFDAPVVSTLDLITATADSATYAVLNAAATLNPPPVRASLVFAGEPFSLVAGDGTRDDVHNAGGLNGEFVAPAGGGLIELAYADGMTASAKAAQIAASLLNRQFTYDLGGYVVQGINGTQLSPVTDRVTVRWNENGATEEVDLTTERDRNVAAAGGNLYTLQVPPERDFDRRAQLLQLLPGQRELREEARQLQLVAASLRQNPQLACTMLEAFTTAFGFDAMPATVFIDPAATPGGTLNAGTPMFKESGDNLALAAGDTPANPVFLGATVLHNEDATGPVRVTATGDGGVIYARVKGPVAVNDAVGLGASVQTYLEGSPTLAVGTVLEAIATAVVALTPVRVAGGGGGGDPVWL